MTITEILYSDKTKMILLKQKESIENVGDYP